MKRVLLVLFGFILLTSSLNAQYYFYSWSTISASWGSGWCPKCYVVGNVDLPNQATGWTGVIAGWGENCYNGNSVTQVDVYYSTATKSYRVNNYTPYYQIPRPDVANYFTIGGVIPIASGNSTFGDKVLSCVSSPNTGWAIIPYDIPSGTWKLTIVMKYGGLMMRTETFITVP